MDLEPNELDESDLFKSMYMELKRRAAWQLRTLPPNSSMQPTSLVHEAYIKLRRAGDLRWSSKSHFCSIAVKAMREVINDRLRRKLARKRCGQMVRGDIAFPKLAAEGYRDATIEDILDLDKVLGRLEHEFPDCADVVVLRFYGGFTMDEIATMEGVSRRTIERRWQFAREYLYDEMASLRS